MSPPLRRPVTQALALLLVLCAVYIAVNLHAEHLCRARGSMVVYHWGIPGTCEIVLP